MSRLQVLSFPDQKSAETALTEAKLAGEEGSVPVTGAAIIARDENGDVHVTRATPASENLDVVPASSAILGLVLGAIVAVPVAGLVVGGAVGIVFSKMRNAKGEPDENYISSRLEPGTWLMVMQLDDPDEHALDRLLEKLGGTDPVAAELSVDDERVLLDAINGSHN